MGAQHHVARDRRFVGCIVEEHFRTIKMSVRANVLDDQVLTRGMISAGSVVSLWANSSL